MRFSFLLLSLLSRLFSRFVFSLFMFPPFLYLSEAAVPRGTASWPHRPRRTRRRPFASPIFCLFCFWASQEVEVEEGEKNEGIGRRCILALSFSLCILLLSVIHSFTLTLNSFIILSHCSHKRRDNANGSEKENRGKEKKTLAPITDGSLARSLVDDALLSMISCPWLFCATCLFWCSSRLLADGERRGEAPAQKKEQVEKRRRREREVAVERKK